MSEHKNEWNGFSKSETCCYFRHWKASIGRMINYTNLFLQTHCFSWVSTVHYNSEATYTSSNLQSFFHPYSPPPSFFTSVYSVGWLLGSLPDHNFVWFQLSNVWACVRWCQMSVCHTKCMGVGSSVTGKLMSHSAECTCSMNLFLHVLAYSSTGSRHCLHSILISDLFKKQVSRL